MNEFKDHFSNFAADYAKYRPSYPPELFQYLAGLCMEHDIAWDAATGSGQTALSLTEHFAKVSATDGSAAQIACATRHPKIHYQTMLSEKTDFPANHFDLVTVSAALHWFDFDSFYPELKRVMKPNGIFAAWCYNSAQVFPAVDAHVDRLYAKVHPVWPKERVYVDENYQTIPFPLREIAAPSFVLQAHWGFTEYFGYLNTWSGVKTFLQMHGKNALDDCWQKMSSAWGHPKEKRCVEWNLHLRVGQK